MSQDRFLTVKRILLEAQKLPVAERPAYLQRACEGDDELQREVESLLAQDTDSPRVFETGGIVRKLSTKLARRIKRSMVASHPETIGAFEILDVLGEGGMGVVYRARQTEPLVREVAIKLIRSGMAGSRVVARFESERQTMARMDHPNIAKIFDAGADEYGRPYFVMELVEGEPITTFCDRVELSVRERLLLFIDVCRAVHHAHQKGVIHRDIKPSNVQVTLRDGKPVAKVIDFGIAKVTDVAETGVTREGQMIGTPEYMSPEQAGVLPGGVDTRSDVYSLGVLLYELLVGERPFDSAGLEDASFVEVQRILAEVEPTKPSTRFHEVDDDATRRAARRGEATRALRRRLKGDPDWIVLKAIRKDPAERYESASAFADDVRRYLEQRPVVAGPPSATYRARKFLWRNRGAVLAALMLLLAVLGGVAGMAWQAAQTGHQRDLADRRLDELRRLADNFVFELHDHMKDLPGSTPAQEFLVRQTAEYLDAYDQDSEEMEVLRLPLMVAYQRLGHAQGELGQTAAALASLEKSISYGERLLEEDSGHDEARRHLGDAHVALGTVLSVGGRSSEALESKRQAAALYAEVLARDPSQLGVREALTRAYNETGFFQLRVDDAEAALPWYRKALELWPASGPAFTSAPEYGKAAREGRAMANGFMGEAFADLNQPERALQSYQGAAEAVGEAHRADPADVDQANRYAVMTGAVGGALMELGRVDEAQLAFERSLSLIRGCVEIDPENARLRRNMARGHMRLSQVHRARGDLDEASLHCERGQQICAQAIAKDPLDTHARRYLVALLIEHSRVELEGGRPQSALEILRLAGATNDSLVVQEPARPDHRFHRADIFQGSGDAWAQSGAKEDARRKRESWQQARSLWTRGRDVFVRLESEGLLPASERPRLAEARSRVSRADSVLADLDGLR